MPGAMGYCSGRCTLVAVCGAQLVSGDGGGRRRREGGREEGREGAAGRLPRCWERVWGVMWQRRALSGEGREMEKRSR